MEHAPLKERRRWGVLVWHILPPVHQLMPDRAASLSQHGWYAKPGQVPKTANFPLLKARWVCSFPLLQSLGYSLCLSIGLEDVLAHTEALTKSVQQVLNDSQQSLSLPNMKCLY